MTREAMEELGASLRAPSALVAPCVLLLLGECPNHGYQLTDRLKDFGFAGASPSRLYRDLRRLEEAGLVASHWESTQHRGPARRVYELTAAGRETLVDCAEEAEQLVRTLRRYVRRVRAVRRGPSASWRPSPRRSRE